MKAPKFLYTPCFVNSTGKLIFIILTCIITSVSSFLLAQQPAFPSAYGGGSSASGGRGGIVVHVTNLNDNGPGSFREAMSMNVPRTIVFDVSGVIVLNSLLSIGPGNGNLTVAGQTAPEGGITIDGARVYLADIDNVIFRYIRFKGGVDETFPSQVGNDSYTSIGRVTNQIFDHCTFAFGVDEAADWVAGNSNSEVTNLTIQNCLFTESVKGAIIGSQYQSGASSNNISILRNVFYNVGYRTPNLQGNNTRFDIINNLSWNSGGRIIRNNGDNKINHIGNYTDFGTTPMYDQRLNLHAEDSGIPEIYTSGNKIVANSTTTPLTQSIAEMNMNNKLSWKYFVGINYGTQLPDNYFTVNPHENISNIAFPIMTADEILLDLPTHVGCSLRLNPDGSVSTNYDELDRASLNQIQLGNYVSPLSENQYEVGEINSISRPSSFYQSNPHIPELWFQANVPAGQDHNDIAPSGYTWLEEYLNQVDYASAIAAEGVTVLPETAELTIPDTLELEVQFIPDNTTNKSGVWTTSDETIATVDANGVVTPVAPGVVTITFTSNDGGFTDTSEITVFPEALQASAGDDQTICEGESVILTATSNSGTTYLWSTGDTTAEIEASPAETSTYTVTVSNDLGEEVTDDVTVTVNPVPVANAGNDQTICLGDSITLTASGGTTYLWSTGETSASITVNPDSETTYTVEAISNDCSSTDAVLISVMPSPEIAVTDDTFIYIGDSTTLTVSGAESYVWNTGESTESITVSPEVTTSYSVTGFANGCQTTEEILVTVLPPINAYAGEDVTICSGETVTLNATGGVSYNWDSGQTAASIEVSPIETTTYTVTVTDAMGGTDTDEVTITVNETPTVTVSDDVIIMEGESTTLTANGAPTYLWNTGDTTDSIIVSPTQTTTYTVTGSNGNCEATAEVVVTVIPEVVANAGTDVTICSGESVNLTATGGSNYSWDSGEQEASITVSPAQTTTYTVTVSDNFGNSDTDSVTVTVNEPPVITISDSISIIEGESTVLVAEGADSYLWSTGETTSSITVSPTQSTTYTVIGISNACEAQALVTVTVEELFQATAGDNQRVCQGDTYEVELTAGPGDTYLWNTGETTRTIYVSPLSTSTYTVTVTQGSQQDTASVMVFVDPNPNVVITNGDSVDILSGDFITLSASGANTYQWSNGATQPNVAVSPSETTTYEVRGYINNCYDEKEIIVNVYQPVQADAGEDVSICIDESTILTASGGDEYLWNTGEMTQSIEVSPQTTTEYTVTVFNAIDYDEDSVIVGIDDSCSEESTEELPDESLDFSVLVYPNPATNIVNIRMTGVLEITEMLMYDFTGKLILSREINNEDNNATLIEKVDVRDLRHGVYFLKLFDNDKEIVKKIIVN